MPSNMLSNFARWSARSEEMRILAEENAGLHGEGHNAQIVGGLWTSGRARRRGGCFGPVPSLASAAFSGSSRRARGRPAQIGSLANLKMTSL